MLDQYVNTRSSDPQGRQEEHLGFFIYGFPAPKQRDDLRHAGHILKTSLYKAYKESLYKALVSSQTLK